MLVFYYFYISPLQTSSTSLLKVILFSISPPFDVTKLQKKKCLGVSSTGSFPFSMLMDAHIRILYHPYAKGNQLGLKRHRESHYSCQYSRKLWFRHYYQWLFLQVPVLAMKCLELVPIPEPNARKGSGGGTNLTILLFHQHNTIQ